MLQLVKWHGLLKFTLLTSDIWSAGQQWHHNVHITHFHKEGATHTCRPVAMRKPGSMTWYATHFKLKLGWKTHTKVHIYGIFTLWFTQQWVHFLLLLLNYALARFCRLSVFVCTFNIAKNILLLFSHVQWGKVSELICFTPKITCIVALIYRTQVHGVTHSLSMQAGKWVYKVTVSTWLVIVHQLFQSYKGSLVSGGPVPRLPHSRMRTLKLCRHDEPGIFSHVITVKGRHEVEPP